MKTSQAIMHRVAALLAERNTSKASFARKIEVSPQVLNAWLVGRNSPSAESIIRMCSVLCVSPSWLMTGRDDSAGHQTIISKDVVAIPMFDVQASCGNGIALYPADSVTLIEVNEKWISRHCGSANRSALNLIPVQGDSMTPTLSDGSIVVVDTSVNRVTCDALFAFVLNDGLYVKRIQRCADGIDILSDNPRYRAMHLSQADVDSIRIVGKVVTLINVQTM